MKARDMNVLRLLAYGPLASLAPYAPDVFPAKSSNDGFLQSRRLFVTNTDWGVTPPSDGPKSQAGQAPEQTWLGACCSGILQKGELS
jgi:hypothetical protein